MTNFSFVLFVFRELSIFDANFVSPFLSKTRSSFWYKYFYFRLRFVDMERITSLLQFISWKSPLESTKHDLFWEMLGFWRPKASNPYWNTKRTVCLETTYLSWSRYKCHLRRQRQNEISLVKRKKKPRPSFVFFYSSSFDACYFLKLYKLITLCCCWSNSLVSSLHQARLLQRPESFEELFQAEMQWHFYPYLKEPYKNTLGMMFFKTVTFFYGKMI